jgi:hypothetical protein
MERWEYMGATFSGVGRTFGKSGKRYLSRLGELNRLGAEGWEAVGISLNSWLNGPVVLLKRRLPESAD